MPRRPRRAGPVWAWALALLVIIILIVVFVARRDRSGSHLADPPAAPASETVVEHDAWEVAPRLADLAALEALASPIPLASLVPLGPAHTGVLVFFDGVVASDVGEFGFWLRTAEEGLVFLRLLEPGFEAGAPGSGIAGRGVIRFDTDGRLAARLVRSDLQPALQGSAFGEYYIETTSSRIEAL